MEKRRLGRTGAEVTIVGLGGIPIGSQTMEQAVAVVHRALDLGVNFIDTAPSYGDSEVKIGQVMATRRGECFLATKTHDRTKTGAATHIKNSLARLKTDQLDLIQLHSVDSIEELGRVLKADGALAALKEAQQTGIVAHIGITGHRPDVLLKAVATGEFETLMVPINIVDRLVYTQIEEELLPLAQRRDIGVIGMKPLAGGILKDPAVALRYSLDCPIAVSIPGMASIKEVEEDVAIGRAFRPLSCEEREALTKEAKELGTSFCRQCGYCLPCTEDIDIPLVFRLEGYYDRYGQRQWAREEYRLLPVKASQCTEDGICEERCPYGLPIRERLRQVVAKLERH